VKDALREIARITKPSGHVFIGEVPYVNEHEGKKYGDSISLWLWWVLRNQGLAQFFTRLKQTFVALFYKEPDLVK
jgi:ubiquinone/menaquinone biosynthesis C-methylase UbiE